MESMFDNGNVILNTVLSCFLRTSHPSSSVNSIFFRFSVLGGCRGQVGGTRLKVSMTGADQRRYLRPDE